MPETFTAYEFGGNWFIGSSEDDSGPIAAVFLHLGKTEERANLMAAAPELLASCIEFLPILDRQLASINPGGAAEASQAYQFAKARVDRMRAAIAKAAVS